MAGAAHRARVAFVHQRAPAGCHQSDIALPEGAVLPWDPWSGLGEGYAKGGPSTTDVVIGRDRELAAIDVFLTDLRGPRALVNAGPNSLVGGNGNDTISGLAGDDILVGNPGDDTIDGGAGTDSCFGDAGTDVFTDCELVNDPAEGPDLMVVSIALGVPPGVPEANTANPWTATIANVGTQPANVYLVGVDGRYSSDTSYDAGTDDPACGTSISQIPGATLAPGASVDVYVGCGAGRTGSYLLALVDGGNIVAETNEANNLGVLALNP